MGALVLSMLGALPAAGQWGSMGGGGNAPDVQYVMDEYGNYTGKKNVITGPDTDGNHYSCAPTSTGARCTPCGECHTAAQTRDKRYAARFDRRRHAQVHLPKLVAKLRPSQKIPWGPNAMVSYRNSEVVVSSRRLPARDLVIFPAGSLIVLNQAGRASFIALPAKGEPRAATLRPTR